MGLTRLRVGAKQIVAFALIGAVIGGIGSRLAARLQPNTIATKVVFSFPGSDKGEYPDRSVFQADDLRSPAVVGEALKRQGLPATDDLQSKIRAAVSIEGVVPPSIVKERERMRVSGLTPPRYVPDEYRVTLALDDQKIAETQVTRLLNEIVAVYRENFLRTYGEPPLTFGNAFEALRSADYPEYELVLRAEIESLRTYLTGQAEQAKTFRSRTTNMSFKDLVSQADLFSRLQMNEALGYIHEYGLTRDRRTALMKLNHHVRSLEEQEKRALEEEIVVKELLAQAQARNHGYVLGAKNATPGARPEGLLVDQGLVDSLIAHDSYNFLIRRALDAGLQVKRIQVERIRLNNLRDSLKNTPEDHNTSGRLANEDVQRAITALETSYRSLAESVRKTHADFAREQFGTIVQITDEFKTAPTWFHLHIGAWVGLVFGAALAAGLALLGIFVGRENRA